MGHDGTGARRRMRADRKTVSGAIILIALAASSLTGQERPREDVIVTLVEVPVRVLHEGRPVRDLGPTDFRIFENGVEQEIARFEIVSRRIADPPRPDPAGRAPRLFLLIFNIHGYQPAVGAAIDDFFRDVFRSSDSVVILTEDRVLNIERGQKLEDFVAGVKDALVKFKAISTRNTLKNFRDLDHEGDRLLDALRGAGEGPMAGSSVDQAMVRFFEKTRAVWEGYRDQFLLPDLGFLELLLGRIRSFEGQKWAICFQQREIFPTLKRASRLDTAIETWVGAQIEGPGQVKARLVQASRDELRRSFDLSTAFSPDLLSDLFLGADMTFHLLLMSSTHSFLSQNFELREVGQGFEAMLKAVCASTGGYLDFSNRPGDTLKKAVHQEDFHYLLVYSPRDVPPAGKRTIEVRVGRTGVEVVSLKRPLPAGPDPIAITEVRAAGQSLGFAVENCRLLLGDGRRRGSASVRVALYDDAAENVFDEAKTLELTKDTMRVSIDLEKLKPGRYFLIIEAVDRLSGASDVYNGSVELVRRPPLTSTRSGPAGSGP